MDKTEFIQLHEFEQQEDFDPDDILEGEANKRAAAAQVDSNKDQDDSDSLLDELGIWSNHLPHIKLRRFSSAFLNSTLR